MAPRKRRAEQMIAPPAPAGDPAPDIDEPDDELDPADPAGDDDDLDDPAPDPSPADVQPAASAVETPRADDVRRGTRPGLRLRRGDRRNRFRVQSED